MWNPATMKRADCDDDRFDDMEIRPTIFYCAPDKYPPPSFSASPFPYFKVQRTVSDSRLFKRCSTSDSSSRNNSLNSKFKESLTQLLLEDGCLGCWYSYRQKNANLYQRAIVAAANFATILISKDGISRYRDQKQLLDQMTDLWKYASNQGKRRVSSTQAWNKCFCELGRKTEKYSLVTDYHLAGLVHDYHRARAFYRQEFDRPYFPCSVISYCRFEGIKKDSIYFEVNNEIRDLTSSFSLTVDAHTDLLILIARGSISTVVEAFLPLLFGEEVEHDRLFEGPLAELFESLAMNFQREIWEELWDVMSPIVVMNDSCGCGISAAVVEVVEVAELRRRALGRRFIGMDVFVWSFYTCGYGLPAVVCDEVVLNTGGEDYHLSQIYRAVIQLVKSLGLQTIELEHFIFIVLYSKYPRGSNVKHFEEFMKVIDADMKERHKLITRHDYAQIHTDDLVKLKFWNLERRLPAGAIGEETSRRN